MGFYLAIRETGEVLPLHTLEINSVFSATSLYFDPRDVRCLGRRVAHGLPVDCHRAVLDRDLDVGAPLQDDVKHAVLIHPGQNPRSTKAQHNGAAAAQGDVDLAVGPVNLYIADIFLAEHGVYRLL